MNVFAAVQRHAPRCRVIAVSSADAYGLVQPAELPVREDVPFRPLSPYGASKAAVDLLAHQWSHGAGLDVVRVRPFNHTGPGQRPDFVCPDFARQLVLVARGERPPLLSVGDLDLVRDFSDVRDVVAAYAALCEPHGLGPRRAWRKFGSGGKLHNFDKREFATWRCARRCWRTPAPGLRSGPLGSAEKLHAATGWKTAHDWRETRSGGQAWRSSPREGRNP